MASRDEIFTNKLFLNAVLPLIKVIASDVPSLAKKFEHAHGVMQVSALDPDSPDGKVATHFVVNCGEWLVHNDKVDTAPHIELEFKSIEAMNAFFKGKMSLSTLPKMKGIAKHPGLFASFMAVLLKMSSLLTAKGIPESEDTKALLVKCYVIIIADIGRRRLGSRHTAQIHLNIIALDLIEQGLSCCHSLSFSYPL